LSIPTGQYLNGEEEALVKICCDNYFHAGSLWKRHIFK